MLFKKCVIVIGAVGGMSLVSMAGCSSNPSGNDGGTEAGMDDTGVKDTGVKDTGKQDTGAQDAGPMCPTPSDVSSFMPPAYKGPTPPQNACSDSDVMTYFTDCVDMYDQTKCNAFIMAHMACSTCLETLDPSKVTTLGASFDRGPYIFLIAELHAQGAVRGVGPLGEALDRTHDWATRLGKVEALVLALLISLHLASRRSESGAGKSQSERTD